MNTDLKNFHKSYVIFFLSLWSRRITFLLLTCVCEKLKKALLHKQVNEKNKHVQNFIFHV